MAQEKDPPPTCAPCSALGPSWKVYMVVPGPPILPQDPVWEGGCKVLLLSLCTDTHHGWTFSLSLVSKDERKGETQFSGK